MNKYFQVVAVSLFGALVILLSGCNSCGEDKKGEEKAALACTQLNFSGYEKLPSVLDSHRSLFKQRYALIKNGTTVSMDDLTINLDESIDAGVVTTIKNAAGATGDNQAGVKLYYGVNTDANNIFLIYKPVLLELNGNSTATSWHYTVVEDSATNYYTLNADGSLNTLDDFTKISGYLSNYSAYMNKRDAIGGAYTPVVVDYQGATSDPAAIIYPIAEIEELILQNQSAITSFNKVLEDKMLYKDFSLLSVTGVRFHNVQEAGIKKHDIYIEPVFDNKRVSFTDRSNSEINILVDTYFKGRAANLGSLCPPNCPSVMYPCK
ncbi:MAG: hypothetical protein KDC07_02700 [Chitinophagaceae bacterium]|nr:hypothetical protein [Chitinophagaceae bacterium]MCB9047128.1 hypothetical protein [Chitinophagales bacterium]